LIVRVLEETPDGTYVRDAPARECRRRPSLLGSFVIVAESAAVAAL